MAPVSLTHGLPFLFPPEAVRWIKKQSPFPEAFMRSVYVAEVLAALGLILPGSAGLASIMAGFAVPRSNRKTRQEKEKP